MKLVVSVGRHGSVPFPSGENGRCTGNIRMRVSDAFLGRVSGSVSMGGVSFSMSLRGLDRGMIDDNGLVGVGDR